MVKISESRLSYMQALKNITNDRQYVKNKLHKRFQELIGELLKYKDTEVLKAAEVKTWVVQ